jgi:hypothetical protein
LFDGRTIRIDTGYVNKNPQKDLDALQFVPYSSLITGQSSPEAREIAMDLRTEAGRTPRVDELRESVEVGRESASGWGCPSDVLDCPYLNRMLIGGFYRGAKQVRPDLVGEIAEARGQMIDWSDSHRWGIEMRGGKPARKNFKKSSESP